MKFVPVRVKLREDSWNRRHQGWWTPTEVDISDGERQVFDLTFVSTSDIWVWVVEFETMINIATPR